MRIASPPHLIMATRTDKEARLKHFIAEGLAQRPEGSVGTEPITIVARNPDSPAARALCAALSESDLRVGARVIFGETNSDDRTSASLLDVSGCEFRVLGDPRFGAAHEQIVAGLNVWTGDCLRRDPNKRDAFEIYHTKDAAIRLFAVTSFTRMWQSARPLKMLKAADVAPEIIAAGQTDDPNARPRNHHH
jgi:hypothetical protein